MEAAASAAASFEPTGEHHAGNLNEIFRHGGANPGAFAAGRGASLCLSAAGARDSHPLRKIPSDVPARAGGLGVAGGADGRPYPGHALGEPHRPRQGLRRDARVSDDLAHTRCAHALRRRQLDDHGRGLDGRRFCERKAAELVCCALWGCAVVRRCGVYARSHHAGAGAHSGGGQNPARGGAPVADAAASHTFPDARLRAAVRPSAGGRGGDSAGLPGVNCRRMGALCALAAGKAQELRRGDRRVFPHDDGPLRRLHLRAGLHPQGAHRRRVRYFCVLSRELESAGFGAGEEDPVFSGGRRYFAAGGEPASWR